jgi:pimeloyl-ACP methyl ester carboxylesterase
MIGRVLVVVGLLLATVADTSAQGRWTTERAAAWQKQHGWLAGANFIPSNAINQLEMWQAETFDAKTIDRELAWAKSLGFNSMRVFLHDLLWTQDAEGFLRRVDQFLAIADRHGIGVMLVLFDGVWDPNPRLGPQRAPTPHVHNPGWLQSPGAAILGDAKRHDALRPYVDGVLKRFRNDRRVHAWDLFNEPDNRNTDAYGKQELKNKEEMAAVLLRKVFAWARAVNADQPLTVGLWRDEDFTESGPVNLAARIAVEESDVISFHAYNDAAGVTKRIAALRRYGRPLLCTEYLARSFGSTIETVLPVLQSNGVAAYTWGLVSGKTQTIYPWSSWTKRFTGPPDVWHHDLFHPDGKPYSESEVRVIRKLTAAAPSGGESPAGLFYEVSGAGEPVVFVHAFSVDRRMWAPQIAAFEDRFRVIRYDLRGHGKSAAPSQPFMAHEDLRDVLDALGVDKATLVGLSAGSEIAVNFALAYPERVRGLVLAAPGLSGVPTPPLPWFQPVIEALKAGDSERAAKVWAETPMMALHTNSAATRTVTGLVTDNARVWTFKRVELPVTPPAVKRLADVKCPALVIIGDKDLPHIHDTARVLVDGIPGATLVTTAGAGHIVNLDTPEPFNDALAGFLGRL